MKTDPNNPNMWEYQDKCVHPDCKDGCKLGMGGVPRTPKNTQQELREILTEYAMNLHAYSNGVGHPNDFKEQTEAATQAINSLVRECLEPEETMEDRELTIQDLHTMPFEFRNMYRQQFLNRWMGNKS